MPEESITRVPFGIQGLDALIMGGIPANSSVFLAGPAGSGKTTIALEFLYKGVTQYGDPGVYISFEESEADIIRNIPYHWDLQSLIDSGQLVLIKYDPYRYQDVIEMVRSTIKQNNARRVVVDSITALNLYVDNVKEIRKLVLDMNDAIQKLGATAIYTGEIKSDSPEAISRFGVEEFISDGVVQLFLSLQGSELVNLILVRKMRGTHHDKKLHPYQIGEDGIIVYSGDQVITQSGSQGATVY